MSSAQTFFAPVSPGGTIGILGGGQLGRMLAMAAARLGLKVHIYSDERDAPAFQVCDAHTVARFDDETALAKFAAVCDAVTFEFENVPAAAAAVLSKAKPTNPNARALATTQDRFDEKSFIASLGLKTANFAQASTEKEVVEAFDQSGKDRLIIKTRKLGYDGKGQATVRSGEEAIRAFKKFHDVPSILESFVPFEFEASVVAVRSASGDFSAYDPAENVHENHILARSIVPARLTAKQVEEAKTIARKIADALDYVGVLGVELFVTKDALLVNEIAPRVHNSGHWTIEACICSQFENHIRAVAGWPLGSTARHSDAVMENLIGEDAAHWKTLAAKGGALHLYGKSEIRAGRKMGHVTYLKPFSK
jgi:5-(carboxyamino)imidazole ribonucleotide synthase